MAITYFLKFCLLICTLLALVAPPIFAQNKLDSAIRNMAPAYSSLGIGVNLGTTGGSFPISGSTQNYSKYAGGINIGIATSFVLGHFLPQLAHPLKIGDYTSTEIGTGTIFSHQLDKTRSNLWAFYRFQIGLQAVYDITGNNRLNLRLVLLDFAHSQLQQNTSGSTVYLAYRIKRLELAGSITAMRKRFIGWVQIYSNLNDSPHFYALEASIYLPGQQKFSINQELFHNSRFQSPDPVTSLTTHTLFITQLKYAILF